MQRLCEDFGGKSFNDFGCLRFLLGEGSLKEAKMTENFAGLIGKYF